MSERKVVFGLSNCHYAKISQENGQIKYGAPVPIPGAVSLALNADATVNNFYADNTRYYVSYMANGGTGDLTVADIPVQMLLDIFGQTQGETSKVLTEKTNVEPAHFALLFRIENDIGNDCYAIYDCVATPPGLNAETINESKTPGTTPLSITFIPRADGKAKARTTGETPKEVKENWFKTVFVENP